ncbi:MAG: ATP-binding protein, partial [Desulfuromonadales bacterium]|nr:ATP-binding protein [Desulfuromonadales bacterium]
LLLNKLNRRIQDNFDLFSVTFEQAAKTNQTIPGNNIAFDELKELCETANIMINENREIKDSLKQRVDKRTSELKEAQAQLLVQERLAVLGQLTATVSHELRNPLGAISNGLHSIETALEIDNLPMAEKAIRLSERSIARCTRIIDELLDYGREEKLNLGPVAIEDLVNETLDDLAISGDIKLTRQLMGKTTVAADHDKLRQVIVNLVINAQQALQDSSQTDKRITVATRKREDTVEIVIEDNGPGVPENLREKIFEPLFSTKNFGIGLGMTIVEKIVMSHKGEITLQPNRTQGCCFVISLPIKDQYII